MTKKDDPSLTENLPSVVSELTAMKKIDKKDFEEYLGLSMDKYDDLKMTPDTAKRYKQHIKALRHGMHAGIPLICLGAKRCPIGKTCPLNVYDTEGRIDYDASTYPLHLPCPVERDMIKLHIIDLCGEYGITQEDITDLSIISKLASLDVLEYRVNMALATDVEGVIVSEVNNFDPKTSTQFLAKKAHPAFEMLERIHRMRQDLQRSMIGTRREKIKAAAITGEKQNKTSLTSTMNTILEKLREQQEHDIIDAEFQHPVPSSDPEKE